jgi:hypothetical protein
VHDLTTPEVFDGIDIALLNIGGSVGHKYRPMAINSGAVMVDSNSAFPNGRRGAAHHPRGQPSGHGENQVGARCYCG